MKNSTIFFIVLGLWAFALAIYFRIIYHNWEHTLGIDVTVGVIIFLWQLFASFDYITDYVDDDYEDTTLFGRISIAHLLHRTYKLIVKILDE